MSQAEFDAIEARCSAATPAPWRWRGNVDQADPHLVGSRRPDEKFGYDVLGHVRRQRTIHDRAVREIRAYYEDCSPQVRRGGEYGPDGRWQPEVWVPDEDGTVVAQAIHDYLYDEYDSPRYDERLAFVVDGIYREARGLAVFEVCRDATDRADPRVYRADIVGLRHPDAEFIANSRADVEALLAEVKRLREALADRVTVSVDPFDIDELTRQALAEMNARAARGRGGAYDGGACNH